MYRYITYRSCKSTFFDEFDYLFRNSVNVDYKSEKTSPEERHHTIELGAQWVHGRDGNVSFDLASKEGLLEEEDSECATLSGEFDGELIC